MEQTTVTALTQLGLSGIFAIACIQLFLRLEEKGNSFSTYLIATIAELRQQNTILMDQNKQLSVALFANNADAQRAYAAMQKQPQQYNPSHPPHFSPIETNIQP